MYMDACSRELQDSLLQAQEVKCDLEEIMHNTLVLSQQIADDLERKLHPKIVAKENTDSGLPHQKTQMLVGLQQSSLSARRSEDFVEGKMRVHELADEIGVSSKELLLTCIQLGFPVRHHMKILDEEQIRRLREHFFGQQPAGLNDDNSLQVVEDGIQMMTNQDQEALPLKYSIANQGSNFSLEEIKNAHPYIAVRTLSEQGYQAKEIARILDRGQGEVNLILNLSRKKIG